MRRLFPIATPASNGTDPSHRHPPTCLWSARDNRQLSGNRFARRPRLRARETPKKCYAIFTKKVGTPGAKDSTRRPTPSSFLQDRAIPLAWRKWSAACSRNTSKSVVRKIGADSERRKLSRRHVRCSTRSALSQLRCRLLTPQDFPKGGGEPYDDVSWELPANFHLDAIPTAETSILQRRANSVERRTASRRKCFRRRPGFIF